jgi:hypothetical protein
MHIKPDYSESVGEYNKVLNLDISLCMHEMLEFEGSRREGKPTVSC